jgi:hypothetical protein
LLQAHSSIAELDAFTAANRVAETLLLIAGGAGPLYTDIHRIAGA